LNWRLLAGETAEFGGERFRDIGTNGPSAARRTANQHEERARRGWRLACRLDSTTLVQHKSRPKLDARRHLLTFTMTRAGLKLHRFVINFR
jgi:hypothetical protein